MNNPTNKQNNLPHWFKGCNCINNFHPLHIEHNVSHLCKIEKVKVITTYELLYQNTVRNVKYLKIDTEGHDCVILKTLFFYIKYLPLIFYPNKITIIGYTIIWRRKIVKCISISIKSFKAETLFSIPSSSIRSKSFEKIVK